MKQMNTIINIIISINFLFHLNLNFKYTMYIIHPFLTIFYLTKANLYA